MTFILLPSLEVLQLKRGHQVKFLKDFQGATNKNQKSLSLSYMAGRQAANRRERVRPSGEQHAGGQTHLQPGEASLYHWKWYPATGPQVSSFSVTVAAVKQKDTVKLSKWQHEAAVSFFWTKEILLFFR